MNRQRIKSILKIIICFVLTVMFFLTIILSMQGKKQNKIIVSFLEDSGYISNIYIGNTNYPLWQYKNKKGITLEENKIKLKKGVKFEIEYSKILYSNISFKSKKNNTLELNINNSKKYIKLKNKNKVYHYTYDVSSRDIFSSFFKKIDSKTIIIGIFLGIVYYIIIFLILSYLKKLYLKLKNGELKILDIIKFALYLIFMYFTTFPAILLIFKYIVIVPLLVVIVYLIYGIRDSIKDKIPEIFVFLVLVFGLTMVFSLPLFHVPDETAHFVKSYSIFNKNEINSKSKNYILFPENISKIYDKYNMDIFNSKYKLSPKEYFSDVNVISHNRAKKYVAVDYRNTVGLSKFCYYPTSIIIFIGFKIGMPFNIVVLLARIINLLLYTIIGYYSLKILPKFKMLFLIIMLFPITIQQAMGIAQDSITNSLFILTLSIALNLIYSKKEKSDKFKIISLIILSIFLGFCKIGYFAVLFLVFLIPSTKFKNKKIEYILKFLIVMPCLILSGYKYLNVAEVTDKMNTYYPISMIFTQPLRIIKICLSTFIGRGSLDGLAGLVDGFGWSTIWHKPLIKFLVVIITFLLLMTAVDKKEKIKFKNRFFYAIVTIIMVGFIYASLLFGWTKIGATSIDGLQCRYFIPIAFLLYMSLSNNYISFNFRNNDFVKVIGIVIINILSFFTIIYSYYA